MTLLHEHDTFGCQYQVNYEDDHEIKETNPALVTPTNATLRGMLSKTWHAEKRGGVWEVESPEFEEVVKLALDEREKLEEAKARSEVADNAVRQLASRVAEDDHSDIDMSGYGFNVWK